MSLVPLLSSAILDVHHDKAGNWLYLDWKGPQKMAELQHASQQLLDLVARTGVNKFLNDSSHITWTTMLNVNWIAKQYLPLVGQAGVEYMACVSAPHLSCYHHIEIMLQPPGRWPHVVPFEEVAAACEWLNNLAEVRPTADLLAAPHGAARHPSRPATPPGRTHWRGAPLS